MSGKRGERSRRKNENRARTATKFRKYLDVSLEERVVDGVRKEAEPCSLPRNNPFRLTSGVTVASLIVFGRRGTASPHSGHSAELKHCQVPNSLDARTVSSRYSYVILTAQNV